MKGDLSDHEIKKIVNEHIHKLFNVMEYLRIGRLDLETKHELFPKLNRYVDEMGRDSKQDLIECNYCRDFGHIRRMITNGEEVYLPSNFSHRKPFRELLKGLVKYSDIEKRRWEGDYSDDIDEAFPVQTSESEEAPGTELDMLKALLGRLALPASNPREAPLHS